MDISKGQYFSYIDDDDFVSEDYVKHALNAIKSGKKVITFKGTQNTDGKIDCPFTYDVNSGRNHKKTVDGVRWKIMLPDHLCIWIREFATEKFHHKNLGEDHDWAKEMALKYTDKDVHHIDEFMYHYEYNRNTSQCRR